jgi:hypothetical protein
LIKFIEVREEEKWQEVEEEELHHHLNKTSFSLIQ